MKKKKRKFLSKEGWTLSERGVKFPSADNAVNLRTQNVEVRRGTANAAYMVIPQNVTIQGSNWVVTRIADFGFDFFTGMSSVVALFVIFVFKIFIF